MIVFDTETTGLPKPDSAPLEAQPQIIEFAGIKLHDETLEELDRIEFLANPGRPLEEIIIKITGLTDDVLRDQPPFGANFSRLAEFFLGERAMCAHFVGFDRSLLTYELRRLGKMDRFPWPQKHICTVEASMPLRGHKLKLGVLHEIACDYVFEDAHRAMPDVEALVRCVRWLRKEGHL